MLYIPDLCEAVGDPDEMFETFDTEIDWVRRDSTPLDEFYANDTPAPYTYGSGEFARLDVCFMNRYAGPRDHLGWHSDDSPEMDPDRPIVTVSLGAVRDIQFRPIGDPSAEAIETLTLEHGSAAVMLPWMQQSWRHRIPKSGRQVGPRVSLTFRGYIAP